MPAKGKSFRRLRTRLALVYMRRTLLVTWAELPFPLPVPGGYGRTQPLFWRIVSLTDVNYSGEPAMLMRRIPAVRRERVCSEAPGERGRAAVIGSGLATRRRHGEH
jgi:hypothetical protein